MEKSLLLLTSTYSLGIVWLEVDSVIVLVLLSEVLLSMASFLFLIFSKNRKN